MLTLQLLQIMANFYRIARQGERQANKTIFAIGFFLYKKRGSQK
jgi:hypothetical protein